MGTSVSLCSQYCSADVLDVMLPDWHIASRIQGDTQEIWFLASYTLRSCFNYLIVLMAECDTTEVSSMFRRAANIVNSDGRRFEFR